MHVYMHTFCDSTSVHVESHRSDRTHSVLVESSTVGGPSEREGGTLGEC